MNIKVMGNISFMPIHSINKGSQPRVGMGYRRLIMGCSALFIVPSHPIMMPMVMPAIEPAPRPIRTRIRLLSKFSPRTPLAVR